MGDGRAWLGPVLREYVVSEAMHALGIPTSRALAAVATGEPVYRETGAMPGAVLTRVAASHIRVGTFQFFAARRDIEALRALFEHTVDAPLPRCARGPAELLEAAIARQARLVAQWMSVGFIHGVMNTDNTRFRARRSITAPAPSWIPITPTRSSPRSTRMGAMPIPTSPT